MSDSESDTSNNVFNFQNCNATVNAKGPNCNFSFQYPMRSTMSRNFERPRYAESNYDQRSYRRETSPMSIQSACDMRLRNFQPYVDRSSLSVFNGRGGRGGSPLSMRSINSSASVRAAEIAFAFNNEKFNSNDLKVIREAYQKLLKRRVRKRIEKRRNMRLKIKSRKRSGGDSGDQASDSSVSSDDHLSVKTYNENISSSRSTRMDLNDFRNNFRNRNILKDNPFNISQNTFKNKSSFGSTSVKNLQNFNNTAISNQFNSMPTQKDRFKNGFLLPSQRFNRSVASSVIMEDSGKPHKNTGTNLRNNARNNCTSSEEEIFPEMTVRDKSTFNIEGQRKRSLDSDDDCSLPGSKRSRLVSPTKNSKSAQLKSKNVKNPSNNDVGLSNSFEFAKPSLPIRKSKNKVQEMLITKSAQPLTDFLEPAPNKIQENVQVLLETTEPKENSNDNLTVDQSDITQNNDVSSRPSFIKRKLFTQNLDVGDKANSSTDGTNSPQSSVYSIQKEKNKARKLVTNQSCLNRNVQEDNNLLDLIHKIVPADHINRTNQTIMNQTKNDVNNKKDNEAKWDIASLLSMVSEDDASETYTDEEIFKADNTTKPATKNKDINIKAKTVEKVTSKTLIPQDNCKVVLKKMEGNHNLQKQVVNKELNLTQNNNIKNNANKATERRFWDTDFESDTDCIKVQPSAPALDNLKKDSTKNNANKTTGRTCRDTNFESNTESLKVLPRASVRDNCKKDITISNANKTTGRTFWDTDFESDTECLTVLPRASVLDTLKKANAKLDNTKQDFENPTGNAGSETSKNTLQPPEVPKYLNNSLINNSTFSNTRVNLSTLSVRSHRTSKKKNVFNETCANRTNSKPDNTCNKKKGNSKEPAANNLEITNSKVNLQSKNPTDVPKSKTNTQNEKIITAARSQSPKSNNKNSKSKSKSEKPSSVNNKKSNPETQNKKTEIKNKPNENVPIKNNQKSKTQRENKNNKKQKSPKNNSKSKQSGNQNENKLSKKSKLVLQPTNTNINNTVEPVKNTSFISGRPLRSCRTPSQNRSGINTSVVLDKTLRSRVINLSSSIENITIKIKPKHKNDKNIAQMVTRKSDVSFSLGSREQTPASKKTKARSRADQRKR